MYQGITLYFIRQGVNSKYSIALQPDSEFKEVFDYEIKKMTQSGILRRIWSSWYLIFENERQDGSAEAVALGFTNVFIPFNICGLGVVIALMLVAFEKLLRVKIPGRSFN